jgi:hypothetical protein
VCFKCGEGGKGRREVGKKKLTRRRVAAKEGSVDQLAYIGLYVIFGS